MKEKGLSGQYSLVSNKKWQERCQPLRPAPALG